MTTIIPEKIGPREFKRKFYKLAKMHRPIEVVGSTGDKIGLWLPCTINKRGKNENPFLSEDEKKLIDSIIEEPLTNEDQSTIATEEQMVVPAIAFTKEPIATDQTSGACQKCQDTRVQYVGTTEDGEQLRFCKVCVWHTPYKRLLKRI